jgi:hypothetical protein
VHQARVGVRTDVRLLADELMDFGRRRKWKAPLLVAAHDCAVQVRKDAALFDAAYDDGVMGG